MTQKRIAGLALAAAATAAFALPAGAASAAAEVEVGRYASEQQCTEAGVTDYSDEQWRCTLNGSAVDPWSLLITIG